MAEWFRQGPAKPRTAVRFRSPPPRTPGRRLRRRHVTAPPPPLISRRGSSRQSRAERADAWRQPWKWALIHAVYGLGASAIALVAWRATEERALRDLLTQLPNTESFLEQAYRARARAKQRREHLGSSISTWMDSRRSMTRSATVQGDQLLMSMGDRLRMVLRDSNVAARWDATSSPCCWRTSPA